MRGVANVVPSNVRFVRVGNSLGATRIRVNIVYEGGLQTKLSNLTTAQKWSGGDSPPSIDFEGDEDEVPEWGGIEQEVSTGTACWSKSVGEDEEMLRVLKPVDEEPDPSFWNAESEVQYESITAASRRLRKRKAPRDLTTSRCSTEPLPTEDFASLPQDSSHCSSVWDTNESFLDTGECYDSNRDSCSVEPKERSSGLSAYCRLCDIYVKSTLRRTHIYSCHVRRPVYKCPLCDVSSTYHLSNIRVHIRKIHNIADEPICFKDEYENEVNAFLYRCFGDHQIFRRQDPEVVACLNDILNCINDGEYCISSTRVKSSGGSIFNEQPIFAARSQPRNTCRVCFESNVKHLERHVLQHHIKQPMFLCPCCNFSSCYSPTSVKNHIKTRHNMFDPLPLDIRDEYAELIQSVYNQCFVDDTSSLASRIAFKQHS